VEGGGEGGVVARPSRGSANPPMTGGAKREGWGASPFLLVWVSSSGATLSLGLSTLWAL